MAAVTVLDLSEWVAGPYCTKLFADFGARVIKVERPDGDPCRRMGPFRGDAPNMEAGGLFLHLNTNKDGIVVDLDRPEGIEIVRRLAAIADVVVESFPPGFMEYRGVGAAALLEAKPDLVVTSITGFGQSGPYREWEMSELIAFAMGGPMSASGNPQREPVKLVGNVIQMQSGSTAANATLGALYWALENGEGQHVDVATFETQNGSLDRRRYYLLSYEYSGTVGERAAVVGAGRPAAGGRFLARDGVEVTTGRIWPDHIGRMVDVLRDDRLAELWATCGMQMMADEPDYINEVVARWVSQRTAREAMREAQAGGWPVVVVNDPQTLLFDDHLVARGFWVKGMHPAAGSLSYTGAPWQIDEGGWALRHTAPLLGQHTDAVLRDLLGYDATRVARLRHQAVVA
jgi:formyl-CoA transferase/CoA:oxalate CoA-transferase